MANNTERFTTVWDAAGNQCRVRKIDAREIVENGGSTDAPNAKAVKVEVEPDELHDDGTPKVTYTEADALEQAEKAPKPTKKAK